MVLSSLSRGVIAARVARWKSWLPRIEAFEKKFEPLDSAAFRKQSLSLRYRARSGEPLHKLLCEAFAMVRVAAARTIEMRHYDVQILGGIAIHNRSIAEMQTGEGKTLTATLPMYVAALSGRGAHLATANDYLARRDAELMSPVYQALGMTTGIIEGDTSRTERHQAYRADVTYGTAKEFGFDFLRDRLLKRQQGAGVSDFLAQMLDQNKGGGDEPVQRNLHFVLIDEADSILIDEARTPLIVSSIPGESQELRNAVYTWSSAAAPKFIEHEHFDYDHETRQVTLSAAGRKLVRELPKEKILDQTGLIELYEQTERAIKVNREFFRDRQYVIRDGEIVIVDEFSGRLAEGRKWRSGIHQAIEAREGLEITAETGEAARITVQDLFLRYERLGGMTGTVANSGAELRKIYNVNVLAVPTNRPPQRIQLPDKVFGTADAKYRAIVDEVREMHERGRPVLIGTRSIDKSELLSRLMSEPEGDLPPIEHDVLNANEIAKEAEIVERAGGAGKVTVATNMAGRGTDIKLGEGVYELNGIHVICTELHESARIDRQLIGRCGRQGDPGSYRQFLSLDDEILSSGLGPRRAARLRARGAKAAAQKNFDSFARLFRAAQRKIEAEHFRGRQMLMHHEKERRKMQIQMGQDPYLDSPST